MSVRVLGRRDSVAIYLPLEKEGRDIIEVVGRTYGWGPGLCESEKIFSEGHEGGREGISGSKKRGDQKGRDNFTPTEHQYLHRLNINRLRRLDLKDGNPQTK